MEAVCVPISMVHVCGLLCLDPHGTGAKTRERERETAKHNSCMSVRVRFLMMNKPQFNPTCFPESFPTPRWTNDRGDMVTFFVWECFGVQFNVGHHNVLICVPMLLLSRRTRNRRDVAINMFFSKLRTLHFNAVKKGF